MNKTIRELCREYTHLENTDIKVMEQLACQLPYLAELTGNDIFIDALTKNGKDSIVLFWASSGKSLYRTSVVGQLACSANEPAVYHTTKTGEVNRDIRGQSQEGLPISQTVVPIRNPEGKVIGVLIREQDISQQVRQEKQVEFLTHTAERLSSTLMYLSMTESTFEDWLGNGIFILNRQGKITYANKYAAIMYKARCGAEALGGSFWSLLPEYRSLKELLARPEDTLEISFSDRRYCFHIHPLVADGALNGCAVSFQDITDLRRQERELNAKSTIIREIHHRVKNNLQNIAALLRLQMRRSQAVEVKAEFAASINRIMAMALVHDVSAFSSWESIDLLELSRRIVKAVIEHSVLPDCKIETHVEGRGVELPGRQAVPLALVINELVSNALKHGVGPQGQGKIIVSISETDNLVKVTVCDNGPQPPDIVFKQVPNSHLGLQIVNSLVNEQLSGSFQLERVGEITRALVCFPKQGLEVEHEGLVDPDCRG
jgi:two-component sensor histidine kinase/PAS domain-containing protein